MESTMPFDVERALGRIKARREGHTIPKSTGTSTGTNSIRASQLERVNKIIEDYKKSD